MVKENGIKTKNIYHNNCLVFTFYITNTKHKLKFFYTSDSLKSVRNKVLRVWNPEKKATNSKSKHICISSMFINKNQTAAIGHATIINFR